MLIQTMNCKSLLPLSNGHCCKENVYYDHGDPWTIESKPNFFFLPNLNLQLNQHYLRLRSVKFFLKRFLEISLNIRALGEADFFWRKKTEVKKSSSFCPFKTFAIVMIFLLFIISSYYSTWS